MTSHPVSIELLEEFHLLEVGTTRSGKTYLLRGLLERLYRADRRVAAVDKLGNHWGLTHSADGQRPGLDFIIFGGRHAHLPMTPADGAFLGRMLVERSFPAIFDVSQWKPHEQESWVADFADAVFEHNYGRGPLHLSFDEAQSWAPQGAGALSTASIRRLAEQGAGNGILLILAVQRLARLDITVRNLAQAVIALRQPGTQDRRALRDLVEASLDDAKAFDAALPQLGTGEGFLWTPGSGEIIRARFPTNTTFDSSRTPKHGDLAPAPIGAMSAIVEDLRAALGSPEGPVKGSAEVRVAELERQLSSVRAQLQHEQDQRNAIVMIGQRATAALFKVVEVALEEADCANGSLRELLGIENLAAGASDPSGVPSPGGEDVAGEGFGQRSSATDISNLAVHPPGHGEGAAGGEAVFFPPADSDTHSEVPAVVAEPAVGGRSEGVSPPTAHTRRRSPTQPPARPAMAERIVAKLIEVAPARLTWRQLASLLGYSPDGGYFRAGKRAALETSEIVEDGDCVRAVVRGRKRALDRAGAIDLWRSVLQDPAPRIIDALITMGAGTKADLATWLGYSSSGGHFRKGLALLRQNGVAIESGDVVRLADPLPGQSA
jgi:hypothetical protein